MTGGYIWGAVNGPNNHNVSYREGWRAGTEREADKAGHSMLTGVWEMRGSQRARKAGKKENRVWGRRYQKLLLKWGTHNRER